MTKKEMMPCRDEKELIEAAVKTFKLTSEPASFSELMEDPEMKFLGDVFRKAILEKAKSSNVDTSNPLGIVCLILATSIKEDDYVIIPIDPSGRIKTIKYIKIAPPFGLEDLAKRIKDEAEAQKVTKAAVFKSVKTFDRSRGMLEAQRLFDLLVGDVELFDYIVVSKGHYHSLIEPFRRLSGK